MSLCVVVVPVRSCNVRSCIFSIAPRPSCTSSLIGLRTNSLVIVYQHHSRLRSLLWQAVCRFDSALWTIYTVNVDPPSLIKQYMHVVASASSEGRLKSNPPFPAYGNSYITSIQYQWHRLIHVDDTGPIFIPALVSVFADTMDTSLLLLLNNNFKKVEYANCGIFVLNVILVLFCAIFTKII